MKILLLAVLLAPFAAFSQAFNSVRFERMVNKVGVRAHPAAKKGAAEVAPADTVEKPPDLPAPERRTPEKEPVADPHAQSYGFSRPLNAMFITSGYGMRFHPIKQKWAFHAGVDLAARADTVRSVLDGIVARAGYDRYMGHCVTVAHGEYTATYAHLSRYFVLKGEAVRSGQPIGITGSTGASTGEHLHFAVRHRGAPMDPLLFLKKLCRANDFLKTIKTEHDERPEDGID